MTGASRSLVAAALVLALGVGGVASVAAQARSDAPAGSGPSYPRTLAGTVGGGLVGAAVVGGVAGLLGEALGGDETIIPIGVAWFSVAAPVGYWLGQAVGASRGASGPGHQVRTRELLLPAALWTGAGIGTWVLIGESFEPEAGVDATSWYVGAAVGAVLQVTGMSVTAYRRARGKHRSDDSGSVSVRLAPTPDGRVAVEGRIRVGR